MALRTQVAEEILKEMWLPSTTTTKATQLLLNNDTVKGVYLPEYGGEDCLEINRWFLYKQKKGYNLSNFINDDQSKKTNGFETREDRDEDEYLPFCATLKQDE